MQVLIYFTGVLKECDLHLERYRKAQLAGGCTADLPPASGAWWASAPLLPQPHKRGLTELAIASPQTRTRYLRVLTQQRANATIFRFFLRFCISRKHEFVEKIAHVAGTFRRRAETRICNLHNCQNGHRRQTRYQLQVPAEVGIRHSSAWLWCTLISHYLCLVRFLLLALPAAFPSIRS